MEAGDVEAARPDPKHPVDRIVELLRERGPMTEKALAEATGYSRGAVFMLILRARQHRYDIWADHDQGGTQFRLVEGVNGR